MREKILENTFILNLKRYKTKPILRILRLSLNRMNISVIIVYLITRIAKIADVMKHNRDNVFLDREWLCTFLSIIEEVK